MRQKSFDKFQNRVWNFILDICNKPFVLVNGKQVRIIPKSIHYHRSWCLNYFHFSFITKPYNEYDKIISIEDLREKTGPIQEGMQRIDLRLLNLHVYSCVFYNWFQKWEPYFDEFLNGFYREDTHAVEF